MPDYSHRYSGRELLDDLRASGGDLHQALHELDSINYLLGGNYVTLEGLTHLLEQASPATPHIADLGCGSGDMLRRVRRLLVRKGEEAKLTGIDATPNVIAYAEVNTPPSCAVSPAASTSPARPTWRPTWLIFEPTPMKYIFS